MYFATESKQMQILTWLIWAVAWLVFLLAPRAIVSAHWSLPDLPAWAAVVSDDPSSGSSVHWRPRVRWRKWAWRQYCAWRRAQRRAQWTARLARLALSGALDLAQWVDLVTEAQFRQHLGALPVLYALLESVQVRAIINRHCPTCAQVDHGTVALVLVLNRLMMPLPAYRIADWMARTVLVRTLGIPAAKFNDDRLARTLDAIQPHCRAIWQEVIDQALVQTQTDLSVLFYDLTAFVVHGVYSQSNHVDFGFAHNTPLGKRKFKVGLSVTADGRIVVDYRLWSGRTADMATVEENIAQLKRLLQRQGWSLGKTIIVGDRANIDDKLAMAYDQQGLHYLAGLRLLKKVHQALVTEPADAQFYARPLTEEQGPDGYWGIPCQVPFEDQASKRKAVHRGLVILSGPMRSALGQNRAAKLQELEHKLHQVKAQIGQPRMRTVKAVQRRADVALGASPVGKFLSAQAYTDEHSCVRLRWQVDQGALQQAMQRDGRYLLVTNDGSLSPQQMLDLYHQKDGVEKRICVSKRDLKVSPVYLHKDERIEAMLLLNMLALLAYSTLERQVRQHGLHITTRRIIEKLESLEAIETHCVDGSRLLRLAPVEEEQVALLCVLTEVLTELRFPPAADPMRLAEDDLVWALPPPSQRKNVA
jgi:transposase